MAFDTGKHIRRLVEVALGGNMPSALWVLKLSYLFGKRENNSISSLFPLGNTF